ncbi:MAG: Gfo/Idh/MocA family oxidoreductase [Armatimonadetes bacterium]|nr:Gfo/Idh/MocA family oxidoreductase [Armatimonadota bacterium]
MDEKKILTRRNFLKASAAAGLSIPYFIKEGVLSAPGRPGANDRIGIGNIGVGGMGSYHVRRDAVAVCDVDANHLADAAKKVVGNPFLCKDYRYLLDRKDVEAVMIATPDHWHALMTVHACQAGKDVYSEKPTCRTIQEGQAMINAAKRYGRVIQIGAQGRSNPTAHSACEFVRNGQIGNVKHVEVWHVKNHEGGWIDDEPPPPELDWDLWLGPARYVPYNPVRCHFNFRWFMDFGGGFIRDRGNHILSLVFWYLDRDNASPVSVEATGEPRKDGIYDVPITMEAKWEFKNPDWTMTWSQPGARYNDIDWGAKFYGDRDTLIVANGDGGFDTEQKAKDYRPPANGVHVYKLDSPNGDATARHRENWLNCIRSREKPVMSVEIGYRVVTLAILANISYLLGRKLQWDPIKEKFIGDDEANRFLAQPYRAPWHL